MAKRSKKRAKKARRRAEERASEADALTPTRTKKDELLRRIRRAARARHRAALGHGRLEGEEA